MLPRAQEPMDLVELLLRLQDQGAVEQGYRCGKREGQAEARRLRCLVLFCLVLELALALPVVYLLHRSGRCAPLHPGEVSSGGTAEIQPRPAQSTYSSGPGPEKRPRVHLTFSGEPINEECETDKFPSLHWINEKPFDSNQINHNGSYLIAPVTGDYFVYAQVTFLCSDGVCEALRYCNKSLSSETEVQQLITKISPRYSSHSKTILKAVSSISEKNKWKKTLYLGGIVSLREGDHVMVNVSNTVLVDGRTPEKTFFGAFLI